MSQCLNPNCQFLNPPLTKFCQRCGNKLLLADRYRAIKYLGEGGFGRTFEAVDEHRFDTPCVIKQFLPQLQSSAALQKATELFKQEGMRLRDLGKHPQIPDLLAFFEQDNRFYLVQEFIDGQDLLKELQQRGKFSEQQVRQLLNELLSVLEFIHNQNVIHRDIKPDNIIRNGNGSLVLIDFGVSKQLSATVLTKIGTITGTPGYAAPEQMHGHVSPASDLYSLAVTCIRLLTGCLLEERNGDWVDKLFDPMQMQWVWRQQNVAVSNELGLILDKMLLFPISERYQSAAEVLKALNSPPVSFPQPKIQVPVPKISVPQPPQPQSQSQSFSEDLGNDIKLDMVYIPGGTFTMGAPSTEYRSRDCERPQHEVTIKPFLMGKYPVTQAQWKAVANLAKVNRDLQADPSRFKGANRPVECVSWYDAVEFCDRLSQHTSRSYRLPSEAEWEYACRAGTTTPFYFGQTITPELANYDANYTYGLGRKGKYRRETTPVGSFPPNAFGLYDLHGNIWEWCADHWHDNYQGAPNDETIWLTSDEKSPRLRRGGSWIYSPDYCRSAFRNGFDAGYSFGNIGFRVVCAAA
ncbi:SUMF1/EgtB/PvdO family nonheme iron enzyme [Planktothrix sp. FACHB-1355]|uniref:SUMF1/EgtB/PvdO family nonheme iron enzyme n=1 Tax=Aerosakkonema funiforme FACHB-1375 TaxID=2949571 RepID=A0A926VL34_9CYAN|nr:MULTISPECIES: bifunctional serine/threonine-protein kinase/formylglycine-generating enzyme family protein [Oscillatoriales]MBD2185253.1 SUMF1/EgtB/PvdO family nonheme iron enzyme [Aerosakkonema funiforme FACHB-1375]MBD3558461.1 SUMF1/EgtB/PvdO family nonheme iron enzyme [Planktothrix sp. FACHB-1355]